ncbi:MAG: N-(2-amino-2-carboxyethyl)-L-glutamate synthase [Blastocatellia bacterium]|jgi:cysteine synthase A|nr:N-(2-amino-2-carboxyethyl)-L-glutamate synthase [Blastocatellia bacterium]
MYEGILSTIGHTPLVRLTRVLDDPSFRLFAKLEAFNPGGSIKDRTALSILGHAMEHGLMQPGATVIESSSGNMGIGLAQSCAYMGLKFICVVDPKTTKQNIEILKSYGARVECVSAPDPITGEFLQARINRVQLLLKSIPNSFWPDQYSNIYNPIAHHQTMSEIVEELKRVDYLFCATSTCGTLRGCAEFVRSNGLKTKIIAVDARGSVIFNSPAAKRLIPGHGAAIVPNLYQAHLADRCVHVSDLDCVVGCRRLVQEEAILAGGSSGAVLSAINKVQSEIPKGATCVAIFADRGERYLDTVYSDNWVKEHFGNVSHLWQRCQEDNIQWLKMAS